MKTNRDESKAEVLALETKDHRVWFSPAYVDMLEKTNMHWTREDEARTFLPGGDFCNKVPAAVRIENKHAAIDLMKEQQRREAEAWKRLYGNQAPPCERDYRPAAKAEKPALPWIRTTPKPTPEFVASLAPAPTPEAGWPRYRLAENKEWIARLDSARRGDGVCFGQHGETNAPDSSWWVGQFSTALPQSEALAWLRANGHQAEADRLEGAEKRRQTAKGARAGVTVCSKGKAVCMRDDVTEDAATGTVLYEITYLASTEKVAMGAVLERSAGKKQGLDQFCEEISSEYHAQENEWLCKLRLSGVKRNSGK